MISVIVPVYNTPDELKLTLKSLVNQSERDFEIIVVDDGSIEPIDSVISNFQFPILNFRIKHGGAPKARNYGFSKSHGEYVLFCDADMILDRECLAKMRKALDENPAVDFVYSDFKYGWKKFKFWEFDAEKLKQINYINTCSMVRRDKVVRWDESLKRFQDWDFWLRVVKNGGRGKYINQVLFQAKVKRGKISHWLPKFVYQLKWLQQLAPVKEYQLAVQEIKEKHGL